MVVKVYGIDGSKQRDIDLADEVFNRSVSTGSIYHAIRNELANLRVGTASTKTRSEVRGSGAKPWRQKGTGRARAGTRQSPLWVGGGVAFGPKPRDYSYKVPKKLKRLAYKSILSQKIQEDRLMVVEDFTVESGKTRELVKILKGLMPENGNRTAIVISGEDSMLKRAGRNVPGLSILSYNRLRAHDLFYASTVIVFEKAAEELGRFYGGGKPGRAAVKPKAQPTAKASSKPAAKAAGRPPAGHGAMDGDEAMAKAALATKPVAKSAEKPATKAEQKPKAKPAAKPTAKASSKPAAKAAGRPPAGRGAKPAAKTPAKTAAKATAKKSGTASSKAKSSKSSGTRKSATRTSATPTAGKNKEGA